MEATKNLTRMTVSAAQLRSLAATAGTGMPATFVTSDGYQVELGHDGWVYLTGPDGTYLGRFSTMDEALEAAANNDPSYVMGPVNAARAERGELAMRAFFGHSEGSLSDLLTDLYAYAQREGITWETAQQIAAQRFANETPKDRA